MKYGYIKYPVTVLVFVVIILVCISGCAQRTESPDGSLPGAGQTLPRTPPTLPGTFGTVPPTLYEDIDEVKETLYALSEEWSSAGVSCAGKSCTGSFVDSAGNTITIRATLYESVDAAHAAYEAEKAKGSTYREITPPQVGDEAYAWQHLTDAGLGLRKSNLVAVFDYVSAQGPATVSDLREIAVAAAGSL